jgi:xanthine dehydrogenase molybdopterin-binding subunit B
MPPPHSKGVASRLGLDEIIGGIAGGIGMALLEETVSDRTGRLVTMSLAEYVVGRERGRARC